MGTDGYMSPERCRPGNGVPVGPPADAWGVGATLFRAAAGERAFPKGDPEPAAPAERWPQLVEPPAALEEKVAPEIAGPVMSSLARDPAQRPAPRGSPTGSSRSWSACPRRRSRG